jgi:hypothetical protein
MENPSFGRNASSIETIKERVHEKAKYYRSWRRENALFIPKSPDKLFDSLGQIDEQADEFKQRILQFSPYPNTPHQQAYKGLRQLILNVEQKSQRGYTVDYARTFAKKRLQDKLVSYAMNSMWGESDDNDINFIPQEALNKTWQSFKVCADNLQYEVLCDIPPLTKPNPYEPAVNLVALGALGIHVAGDSVRADLPMIIGDDQRVLACWIQGKPLMQYHDWDVSCSDRENIKTF